MRKFSSIIFSLLLLNLFSLPLYAEEEPHYIASRNCGASEKGNSNCSNMSNRVNDSNEAKEEEAPPIEGNSIMQPGSVGIGLTLGLSASPLSLKVYAMKNFSIELGGPLFMVFPMTLFSFPSFELLFLYNANPFYEGSTVDIGWEVGGGGGMLFSLIFGQSDPYTYVFLGDVGIQFLLKKVPIDFVLAYRPYMIFDLLQEKNKNIFNLPYNFSFSTRIYF